MLSFSADPRDGSKGVSACNTCCCAAVVMAAGETNKFLIDYHEWAVPLMGEGLITGTQFSIETKAAPVSPVAPENTGYIVSTTVNGEVSSTVATNGVDPQGGLLEYRLVPFFTPLHGTVTLDLNGSFVYKPFDNFKGYDRFFFSTISAEGEVIHEVAIKIGPAEMPPAQFFPPVSINYRGVAIDYQNLSFALTISPAVRRGDVYTLTIRQPARDCDCNVYFHTSCYAISIGKC